MRDNILLIIKELDNYTRGGGDRAPSSAKLTKRQDEEDDDLFGENDENDEEDEIENPELDFIIYHFGMTHFAFVSCRV